jgi:hypothetical protein
VAWVKPGDPAAIGFLRAVGFAPAPTAETRPQYGVPAILDAAGKGEDLAPFERPLQRPI